MAQCEKCGQKTSFMMNLCDSCTKISAIGAASSVSSAEESLLDESECKNPEETLSKRYKDAYNVAKITVGYGEIIKYV